MSNSRTVYDSSSKDRPIAHISCYRDPRKSYSFTIEIIFHGEPKRAKDLDAKILGIKDVQPHDRHEEMLHLDNPALEVNRRLRYSINAEHRPTQIILDEIVATMFDDGVITESEKNDIASRISKFFKAERRSHFYRQDKRDTPPRP